MHKFLIKLSRYFLVIGILFTCSIANAQYREMVYDGGIVIGTPANIPYNGFENIDDWINTIGEGSLQKNNKN